MANRRMISKDIVCTDLYLEMPVSARDLYIQLIMNADDDGFVKNPKMVMRLCGATVDDMKILMVKNYVIPFDSGVIVITHWKIHNTIQGDRYKQTTCLAELEKLSIDNSKSYFLKPVSKMDTPCIQNVSNPETQIRLNKDNKGSVIQNSTGKGYKGETQTPAQENPFALPSGEDPLTAEQWTSRQNEWLSQLEQMAAAKGKTG